MRSTLLRVCRLGAASVLVAAIVVALASPASAHNSLESTDPPSGSVLSSPLSILKFRFAAATPLDTVQIEVIDSAGSRSTVANLAHGESDREVVVTVPPELSGETTYRWRLVGTDGHVVTGRVQLTLVASSSQGDAETAPTGDPAVSQSQPTASGDTTSFDSPFTTPEWFRWTLRVLGFIAVVLLAGATATAIYIWPGSRTVGRLRVMTTLGVVMMELTAVLQLAILAGDISGDRPLTSASGLSTALGTDAGKALLARIALCALLAGILLTQRFIYELDRWLAVAATMALTVGTFSVAGHARSMRWSWLGIPLDVSHMLAASAWLGGLAAMAVIVMPLAGEEVVEAVRRFALLALGTVAVVGASGILQSVRLLGSPFALASTGHGRLLLGKLVVLAGMLLVADVNRRRVERRFRSEATPPEGIRWALSRAMVTESIFGAVVLAVTAALVVSPPGVSNETSAAAATPASVGSYIDRVLSSDAGQIRVTLDQPDATSSEGLRITVFPLGTVKPARVTVRTASLLKGAGASELILSPSSNGYQGRVELPGNDGVRLQVVLDDNEAASFVATLPPFS